MGSKCNTPIKMIKEIADKYQLDISHLRRSGHDLRGQIFGKLTVLNVDTTKKKSHTYWICKCQCGNICSINSESLVQGKSKQCKQCHNKKIKKYKIKETSNLGYDMIGKKFGKLTVLSLSKKTDSSRRLYWNCKCDCGSEITVAGAFLRSGNTQSCGCLLSKGEEKIASILQNLGFSFQREYKFNDLIGKQNKLRFDFYIQSLNCCIEFQGKQHFYPVAHFGGPKRLQEQQFYDNIKRSYCKNNNIKLIEIPYTDYNILNQEYLLNLINQ